MAFSHLSWWLSGRKDRKQISKAGSVIKELDISRFPEKIAPSERVKHKWHSREEGKIDKECDFVIVRSDEGCISDVESVDSDWSIGWLEPHGTGFSRDDDESHESDNSFAVLVPCYGSNYGAMLDESPKNNLLSNVGSFSDESKKYVENWISSLPNT
ncbi:uncharacterized protein LOC131655366 [Vicia villosa]|uniref:uncharacterized protein LOC131655366 n=1 Tax=Vicia villosa TaxID=3911 RepID=UPI00273BFFD9|nr:uncharacterized protein LOC131655366 [Vicia villosa]XP_058781232.1 uncharacterized protein LOC131655366 [Vicia villosa]